MAIYQRGNSYYYDFVYKGQRHTGCIGPVSRTTAKEEETRKKTEVIEGRLNPAKARKSPRFDAFAKEYLDWLKENKRPTTSARVASLVRCHLVPFFGAKRLNEITAWHLEQYKKARKDAGRKPGTINLELGFLKHMLRNAKNWNKLAEYIGGDVKPFTVGKGKTRILSEEEEATILAACSPALRRVVEGGLLTGFRRQELAYLRPEDVDLARGEITVAAAYSKNGESRTLSLTTRLRTLLEEAIAGNNGAATVFVTEHGTSWTPVTLTETFRQVTSKAIGEALGPHVLRHTFASRLVMAGVDLRTVQELLGHKRIDMTVRYAHPTTAHQRQALESLERRFPAAKSRQFSQHPPAASPPIGAKVVAIR